jgi:hypothetical protein
MKRAAELGLEEKEQEQRKEHDLRETAQPGERQVSHGTKEFSKQSGEKGQV